MAGTGVGERGWQMPSLPADLLASNLGGGVRSATQRARGGGGSLCKVLGEPFESKYVFFKVMSTSLLSWIVSFLMVRFINQHS